MKDLLPKVHVRLEDLVSKSVAVDAYNALYQFLAIIRQPDGTPLRDQNGTVTSHLSGLFYRTANLTEIGIRTAYVFDGEPPILKKVEIGRRKKLKREAAQKYERALKAGKVEEARTYAQATSQIRDYMEQDSKHLLTLMGIPWVQAPSEGEAQAAHMAKRGITDYCASQDYDSLLFGAPALIRNLTISGRRKLPKKPVYVEVKPELVEFAKIVDELAVSHEQLVDIGILIGTDYNPEGVKGIGPKTALALIKEHGTLDKVLEVSNKTLSVDPLQIRSIFLKPKVVETASLRWKEPDVEGVVGFLCRRHDFSEERVRKALEKMKRGAEEEKGKTTLDEFFASGS